MRQALAKARGLPPAVPMQAAQQEAGQATAANAAQLGELAKADDPVLWKQLTWRRQGWPVVGMEACCCWLGRLEGGCGAFQD